MVGVFFRPKIETICEILCFSSVNLTTLLSVFGEKNYCQFFLSSKNRRKKNPEIYGPTNDFCLQENKNKRSK
jgi:hypothetical protein